MEELRHPGRVQGLQGFALMSFVASSAVCTALIATFVAYWVSYGIFIPGDAETRIYFRYPPTPPPCAILIDAQYTQITIAKESSSNCVPAVVPKACATFTREICQGAACPEDPNLQIVLAVTYPRSEHNLRLGPINVELTLTDSTFYSRPLLIPYSNSFRDFVQDLIFTIPAMLNLVYDGQMSTVAMTDLVPPSSTKGTMEVCLNPPLHTYYARVDFFAQLSGWRYLMRKFPVSTGMVLLTTVATLGGVILLLLVISFLVQVWLQGAHVRHAPVAAAAR
eukprot:GEMP01053634.1.p1 GENE.GEMP01053634.1~~GEMP01053634.1.p1  ORF type:complete len:279 (-),score=54.09 GEMP01053634.1:563-1399(-)